MILTVPGSSTCSMPSAAMWPPGGAQVAAFAWIGSALLLVACAQVMVERLEIAFPWQAALLAEASVCAAAAIVLARYESARKTPEPAPERCRFDNFVLGNLGAPVQCLMGATAMLAQDVFLAGRGLVSFVVAQPHSGNSSQHFRLR